MIKFLVSKFRHLFFKFKIENNHNVIVDITLTNYVILALAILGIVSVFMKYLIVSIISFIFVFLIMNIKSTIYYSIYRKYATNDQELLEIGSKYSFSDPKTLILNQKEG